MLERSEGPNSRSIFVRKLTVALRKPTLGLRVPILRLFFVKRVNHRSEIANSRSIFSKRTNPRSKGANSTSINFCELTIVLRKITLGLRTFI